MERKVACGFFLSVLFYSIYILCGILVIAMGYPLASSLSENPEGHRREVICRDNVKIYAAIGALAAFRSLVGLCRSFYRYLNKLNTFPTERELWVRVGIKAYVALHGLILFLVFRKSHDLQHIEAQAKFLWGFFSLTLWLNVVSCCLLPFSFKSSLQQARRLRQEELANGPHGGRPISSDIAAMQYQQHHQDSSFVDYSSPNTNGGGGMVGGKQQSQASVISPGGYVARMA